MMNPNNHNWRIHLEGVSEERVTEDSLEKIAEGLERWSATCGAHEENGKFIYTLTMIVRRIQLIQALVYALNRFDETAEYAGVPNRRSLTKLDISLADDE